MKKVIADIENAQLKKDLPAFKTGDTLKVVSKIKEGEKERLQTFEGLVIKKQGHGARATFTVRKIVMGVGVERMFPLHSPRIEKIQVVRSGKVRRSKIYYMRKLIGSAATKVAEQGA